MVGWYQRLNGHELEQTLGSRKLTEWIREMKRLLGQYSFMINHDVYVIS